MSWFRRKPEPPLEERWAFCSECGSAMHWQRWLRGFEVATGAPKRFETWQCERVEVLTSGIHDIDRESTRQLP